MTAPSTTDAAALVRELVSRAISRIRFTYAAIPTTLTFDEDRFAVDLSTYDRETGESTTVRLLYWLPPVLASHDAAVEWIYRCVREGWVHELNEAIFVDGTRRRDLHKPSTHTPGGTATVMPPDEAAESDLSRTRTALAAYLLGVPDAIEHAALTTDTEPAASEPDQPAKEP